MQDALKFLFVINPVSGGKEKTDWETAIHNYFQDLTHTFQIYLLTGENDTASVQYYIHNFQPDRVVAVGGDGTVRMLANLLKETNMALGILPAGSANGMAKDLEIPADPKLALDVIVNGEERKIHLLRINEEEICIHLSDIGMNAMIVKYYDDFKGRGWMSYAKALWKVIWRKQKFRCTINTEDGTVKRKAYMIVVANATKYGMGAVINPVGDLADTKFEIIVVRKLNVFAVLNSMFRKKPFNPEKIEIFKTSSVEIVTQRSQHFQIDGEYLGKRSHVKARILPGILKLLLPPKVA